MQKEDEKIYPIYYRFQLLVKCLNISRTTTNQNRHLVLTAFRSSEDFSPIVLPEGTGSYSGTSSLSCGHCGVAAPNAVCDHLDVAVVVSSPQHQADDMYGPGKQNHSVHSL